MKNVKWLGYLFMMVVGAAELKADSTHNQIISLSDVNDKTMEAFAHGKMNDLIVACQEGTRLSFKLNMKGQYLALESAALSPLYLKVLKTCYIRCEEENNLLFSADLKEWKDFSEFFTGAINLLVREEEGEVVASLQLELNERSN